MTYIIDDPSSDFGQLTFTSFSEFIGSLGLYTDSSSELEEWTAQFLNDKQNPLTVIDGENVRIWKKV